MALFKKPKYSTLSVKKKDIPKDLWTKCPLSGEIVYNKELEQNLMVVSKSGHHFPLDAPARIKSLIDEDTFTEYDIYLESVDPLNFKGIASYTSKIEENKKKTNLNDAVICGTGNINSIPVSIAAMDFRFLGGSMGSVVGEKITRTIERAANLRIPLIIVSASGGARMYEGIFSLMQMAKTSAALSILAKARIPFISLLTNPTMAGVMASFASLGDVILAEPRSMIGFAGQRVIKETTQQKELPPGFQTAEFLLEHGLIDQVVSRNELKGRISSLLKALYNPTLTPVT